MHRGSHRALGAQARAAAPPGTARLCNASEPFPLPRAQEPAPGHRRTPIACSSASKWEPAVAEAGLGDPERGARAGGGCGARARTDPRPGPRPGYKGGRDAPLSFFFLHWSPKAHSLYPYCTPPPAPPSLMVTLGLPRCALQPGAGEKQCDRIA